MGLLEVTKDVVGGVLLNAWHRALAKPFTGVMLHYWDWDADGDCWVRVLFTLHPEFRNDGTFLLRMAGRFRDAGTGETCQTDFERQFQAILDSHKHLKRTLLREIPVDLTDGVQMFTASALLSRNKVPKGFTFWHPDHRLLPCRMNPKSTGPVFIDEYRKSQVRRRYRDRIKVLEKVGFPVLAMRIGANHELYGPGDEDRHGMVAITFEDVSIEFLLRIRERLYELRTSTLATDDEMKWQRRFDDLRVRLYSREPIPPSLTEGIQFYHCDLLIRRACLPRGYLRFETDVLLPCLAEPGEEGALELISFK